MQHVLKDRDERKRVERGSRNAWLSVRGRVAYGNPHFLIRSEPPDLKMLLVTCLGDVVTSKMTPITCLYDAWLKSYGSQEGHHPPGFKGVAVALRRTFHNAFFRIIFFVHRQGGPKDYMTVV